MKQRVFWLLVGLMGGLAAGKTVYIVPIGDPDGVKIFYDPYASRDEIARPFYALREGLEGAGYTVKFTRDGENLVDFAGLISLNGISAQLLSNLQAYDRNRCLLFIFEPPVVMPQFYQSRAYSATFGKIFVMFDDLVDHQLYYKFHYPQPCLRMVDNVPSFRHKKFCVMINGNKDFQHPQALYGARRQAIRFFETFHPAEFDLYGPDWHGYRSWKGSVAGKWEVLKNYRFNICYENMHNQHGYITEKIFDSFVGGCVPVYWGASNITDYVPANCFIDRRNFRSDEELYAFLKRIDEQTYDQYLENIRNYLKSAAAYKFSCEHFVETIKKGLGINT